MEADNGSPPDDIMQYFIVQRAIPNLECCKRHVIGTGMTAQKLNNQFSAVLVMALAVTNRIMYPYLLNKIHVLSTTSVTRPP